MVDLVCLRYHGCDRSLLKEKVIEDEVSSYINRSPSDNNGNKGHQKSDLLLLPAKLKLLSHSGSYMERSVRD